MCVLIGGSGSSGSTMLLQKLSTHPDVFAGPELNFFNKEQLFENWDHYKLRIIPFFPFVSTKGWQIYRRNTLAQPEYGWTKSEVKRLLQGSKDIVSFTDVFFNRPLHKKGAQLWIEKTPSNVYSFASFLEQFPTGKVIHIVRNPLDSMASMYRKDARIYYGAGTWIYNNAVGLSLQKHPRYLRVSYESLVQAPETILNGICDFLEISKDNLVLDGGNSIKHIPSWNNNPSHSIKTTSLGTFERLDLEVKNRIHTALSCIQVSQSHKEKRQLLYLNAQEICGALGYTLENYVDVPFKKELEKQLRRDKRMRTLKGYATGGDHFPLEIL